MEPTIKIHVNQDCTLKIEVSAFDQRYLCTEYVYLVRQYNQASKWFDDSTIPPEQKEKFFPVFENLLNSLSFMYNLLRATGVSAKDLAERIDVPF